jgi:hypothetical protein
MKDFSGFSVKVGDKVLVYEDGSLWTVVDGSIVGKAGTVICESSGKLYVGLAWFDFDDRADGKWHPQVVE